MSLVGGVPALDLTNTRSGLGTDGEVDHLQEPADLLEWAEHAGVVKARGRRALGRDLASGPKGRRALARLRRGP